MKICLFSDIHGNGAAFQSAYKMIVSQQADMNIFLGDLCGYYYDQIEIFYLLSAMPNLIAIKGNHDVIFLKVLEGDEGLRQMYLKRYGYSMENLLDKDTTELAKWLSSLPETYLLEGVNILCCHGSPWDVMEGYVYPDSSLEDFHEQEPNYFFLGHTHYPMYRRIGDKVIVNPGSLGQPRNGGWPTYKVIDPSSKEVVTKEVVYDKAELRRRIDEIGDTNPYLKDILNR